MNYSIKKFFRRRRAKITLQNTYGALCSPVFPYRVWLGLSQPGKSPAGFSGFSPKIENAARVKRGCGDHPTYLFIDIGQHRSNPVFQPRTSGKQNRSRSRFALAFPFGVSVHGRSDRGVKRPRGPRSVGALGGATPPVIRPQPRPLPGTFLEILSGPLSDN